MTTWAERLAESIKRHLNYFKFTPVMQHKPLDQDDDIAFWSDIRYMQDLSDAIQQECTLAKYEDPPAFCTEIARPLAAALAIPVESERFWQEFGEWPVDYAAHLITMWRFDNEMRAWMDKCGIDEVSA